MKVLLLQDVRKIGKKGEVKDVNQGHATNFLIPRKLAKAVSNSEIKNIALQNEQHEEKEEVEKDLAIKDLTSIKGKRVVLKEKANEKGHLFSQIHKEEIVKAISNQFGISIKEDSIDLDDPIKELGEHKINASVFGTKASFDLVVETSS